MQYINPITIKNLPYNTQLAKILLNATSQICINLCKIQHS